MSVEPGLNRAGVAVSRQRPEGQGANITIICDPYGALQPAACLPDAGINCCIEYVEGQFGRQPVTLSAIPIVPAIDRLGIGKSQVLDVQCRIRPLADAELRFTARIMKVV